MTREGMTTMNPNEKPNQEAVSTFMDHIGEALIQHAPAMNAENDTTRLMGLVSGARLFVVAALGAGVPLDVFITLLEMACVLGQDEAAARKSRPLTASPEEDEANRLANTERLTASNTKGLN